MKERDRNREEQLNRLFELAGPESIPMLTPDPGLPTRVRRLAAARTPDVRPARWSPRWAWVSFAGAAFAASIALGGFIGHHVWQSGRTNAVVTAEARLLMTAWTQSVMVEDVSEATIYGEVEE
jgi:hypothetical protein